MTDDACAARWSRPGPIAPAAVGKNPSWWRIFQAALAAYAPRRIRSTLRAEVELDVMTEEERFDYSFAQLGHFHPT
jgi:hypothetical protein